MSKVEVTEGVIRGLKQEFDRLVLQEFQAHEEANQLSRKRGVSEYILEQALEELMYDVDKNPKYRCPKCGGRVQTCEAWTIDGLTKRFGMVCFTCGGEGTSTRVLRKSRVEALLDWFNICNEEESEDE